MKEIKFATSYEPVLSFEDKDFKIKYEEQTGGKPEYIQMIGGEAKHMAVCPRCNNPVVILGIFKKIDVAPHARHAKGINIPGVAQYDEHKYLRCPYHVKHADYVKEYVPETEEPERQELYRIAKEHFDKAIYLLQKTTGIRITLQMAEELARNYAMMRAYNYIDATVYNIPWYLLYSYTGFPLYHMIVRKNTTLHNQLVKLGLELKDSKIKDHVYVADNDGYLLLATDYRYTVDKDDHLKERLHFSIVAPDENVTAMPLHKKPVRFSIPVDSYHFGNLISFPKWKTQQSLLEIAEKYMNP